MRAGRVPLEVDERLAVGDDELEVLHVRRVGPGIVDLPEDALLQREPDL